MYKEALSKAPIILLIVAALAGLGYLLYLFFRPKPPTLYDRLGGIYSISAVVNHFSDALIDNPIVGKHSQNKFLANWHTSKLDRLPGLKFMRTLWLSAVAGGPFKFVSTKPGKCPFSLENVHKDFQIAPYEFDAVATELAHSLDVFGVPAKEKGEVLAAFAIHKPDVTLGYDLSHNQKPGTIPC